MIHVNFNKQYDPIYRMEIFRDKAGNRIIKNDLTGQLEGRNAEGGLLDRSSFKTLAKRGKIRENFKFV